MTQFTNIIIVIMNMNHNIRKIMNYEGERQMKSDQEIIDSVRESIPYLRQLTKEDLTITLFVDGICDSCFCDPGSDAGIAPGTDMSKDPGLMKVTQTGKPIHNVLPRELFGKALEGDVVPVKNESNQVIAIITSGYETEKQYQVEAASKELSESLEHINHSISHIADGTMNLTDLLDQIQQFSTAITSEINNITEVINKIQKSAAQSNILALNASIEAARAGDAGRGFSVVATSMGEFAKSNSQSAKTISDKLGKMFDSVNSLTDIVNNANEISTNQSAEVQDMTANMQTISENARNLNELAKNN